MKSCLTFFLVMILIYTLALLSDFVLITLSIVFACICIIVIVEAIKICIDAIKGM